jgi:hypothetical protein
MNPAKNDKTPAFRKTRGFCQQAALPEQEGFFIDRTSLARKRARPEAGPLIALLTA